MAQSSSKQDAFNAARIYVTQTLLLWKLYGQLFRTSEDYIKVLNDGAPHFFGFVQEAFVVDILRRLAALADPASGRGGKDQNLSLQGLMQLLKIDKATHPSVGPLWAKFQNAVAPTVSYRHKVIGHIDLPTAIGQAAQPQVLIRHVLQSMELLESLMNAIELAAFNSTTSYDINLSGDGHTIVRCVRKSRNYADLAVEYFYARPAEVDATALLARIRDDNYS